MRDFNLLWAGQTVSMFGSVVSRLAIPTMAIFVLHATAFQVGALTAVGYLAFPVLGVIAGVFVDRWPRRRVLICGDAVRALALGSIPLAAVLGALSLAQLYVVALVVGVATVFFDVAYQAYLPEVVESKHLSGANARLEISSSAAQIGGNSVAGGLIAALGAALTVGIDAASFVVSAFAVLAIRGNLRLHEVTPTREVPKFFDQLREGLATVFHNPPLLRIVSCTATSNLGSRMLSAVYLVYAYRVLHLSPGVVGLILGLGNLGFAGALLAPRLVRRFSLTPILIVAMTVTATAQFLVPLALVGWKIPLLLGNELLTSAATPVYNIAQVSWRQSTVPIELQGRMNATVRTVVWGTIPLGAFVGGAISSVLDIVPVLIAAAVVQCLAVLWLFDPRVRAIRSAV